MTPDPRYAGRSIKGPSPFLLATLRGLLRGADTVPALAMYTGLAERTIRAQITALRANNAIRKAGDLVLPRRGGVLAVYVPVVMEV